MIINECELPMNDQNVIVGLISDTHGLLRSRAKKALQGVGRIIHAGDIDTQAVLDELGAMGPVTAALCILSRTRQHLVPWRFHTLGQGITAFFKSPSF